MSASFERAMESLVEEAIAAGKSPRDVVIALGEWWADALNDKARSDAAAFRDMLARRP